MNPFATQADLDAYARCRVVLQEFNWGVKTGTRFSEAWNDGDTGRAELEADFMRNLLERGARLKDGRKRHADEYLHTDGAFTLGVAAGILMGDMRQHYAGMTLTVVR